MTSTRCEDEPGQRTDGSNAIRTEFDWSVVPPSTAIVETVAARSGREPTTMNPIYDTVDTDAIDALIRSAERGASKEETSISFEFADHDVTVRSDGSVVVRPV